MDFVRDPNEIESDEFHRRVAARIRREPELVAAARARVDGWLARGPVPARLEWRDALLMLTPNQLADFLESDSPRARRMRSSSPFFGMVFADATR